MSDFTVRALSALVIMPVAVVFIWIGGWALDLLFLAMVAAMVFEWRRMVAQFGPRERGIALVAGASVILLCGLAAHALRGAPHGLDLLAWLVIIVMATDIGAYAAGRSLGGPKLAPRISPKKTWSGLMGGMAASVLITLALSAWVGRIDAEVLGAAAALSLIAQIGDLCESWCKRRAGVKDSGGLIPGHGGILDRMDGFLTAAPALWVYHVGLGGGLQLDLPPVPL